MGSFCGRMGGFRVWGILVAGIWGAAGPGLQGDCRGGRCERFRLGAGSSGGWFPGWLSEAFEAGEALVELAVEGGFVAVESGGFGGGVEEGEVGGLGVVLGFDGFEGFEVGFEAVDLGSR